MRNKIIISLLIAFLSSIPVFSEFDVNFNYNFIKDSSTNYSSQIYLFKLFPERFQVYFQTFFQNMNIHYQCHAANSNSIYFLYSVEVKSLFINSDKVLIPIGPSTPQRLVTSPKGEFIISPDPSHSLIAFPPLPKSNISPGAIWIHSIFGEKSENKSGILFLGNFYDNESIKSVFIHCPINSNPLFIREYSLLFFCYWIFSHDIGKISECNTISILWRAFPPFIFQFGISRTKIIQ